MGTSPITLRAILSFLFVFFQLASALKFDLVATSGGGNNERCIRNFVSKDQLVVVTAIVGGTKGDGQRVNIHVCGILSGCGYDSVLRLLGLGCQTAELHCGPRLIPFFSA
jgi:hypothetical protein